MNPQPEVVLCEILPPSVEVFAEACEDQEQLEVARERLEARLVAANVNLQRDSAQFCVVFHPERRLFVYLATVFREEQL